VTARHSVHQISQQQLAQVGLGIGMVLSPTLQKYGQLAGAGLQLLFLKYSRDDERQADSLGFYYALNDNYDVRQMAPVFAALQRESQLSKQSPVPNFLATHPDPGERVKTAEQRVAQLNRPLDNAKRGTDEYMQTVNGLVYGQNPRDGFFEGTTFYHPDMRFKVNFPQGWQTLNTSEAVMAGSPQQDAVIQLTLAQGSDPNSAAQQFLSQQGIQAGQTMTENINGSQAVASTFQAQTQQGVVRGLATFLSYGGKTFQILGYSGAQQFDQYAGVFRQTAESFSSVNDPRILNVQPNRVQVVRVDRTMTLTEFNQQHPSVIPIEELALINQVEGPSSSVPAGTYLKQVLGGQTKGS
jgi:predicted Zn-dependent protease